MNHTDARTKPPLPSAELLPCPFCGNAEMFIMARTCDRDTPYNAADRAFPIVMCRGCHAQAVGKDWGRAQTAVEAWNRRPA